MRLRDHGIDRQPGCLDFGFGGIRMRAFGSGALFIPAASTLVVSDLHLGKSERIARQGSQLLPPYETPDTLERLRADIDRAVAGTVICLGDSFDDNRSASHVTSSFGNRLAAIGTDRRWIWITGNHDPDPDTGWGETRQEFRVEGIRLRHCAGDRCPELSGHYHPKARISSRGRPFSRPCFLVDRDRIILPAYGTYTGGLDCREPPLSEIMRDDAGAILTGPQPRILPVRSLRPGRRSRAQAGRLLDSPSSAK